MVRALFLGGPADKTERKIDKERPPFAYIIPHYTPSTFKGPQAAYMPKRMTELRYVCIEMVMDGPDWYAVYEIEKGSKWASTTPATTTSRRTKRNT